MPLPKTKDVGKVMAFLKKDKPNMPRKQKIAIALRQTGQSKYSQGDVEAAARRKFS